MKTSIILSLLLIISSNICAQTPYEVCREKILLNYPNSKNIVKPAVSLSDGKNAMLKWDGLGGLRVVTKEGASGIAFGRCIVRERTSEIVFLQINLDTIVSMYSDEIRRLQNATRGSAFYIAREIGLSIEEIDWIRWNGGEMLYSSYHPKGVNVIGTYPQRRAVLESLDAKNIVILDLQNNRDTFEVYPTDISSELSEKL